MHVHYNITHTTCYRYSSLVTFGEHRVMFRPRDSHDQRVLATDLQVSPEAVVRMIQDPHSNSVALVTPLGAATELKIVCSFTIEHALSPYPELQLSPSARDLPVCLFGRRAFRPRTLHAPSPRRPRRRVDPLGSPVHAHRWSDRHA
jgi:hypothetical protein